MTSCGIRYRNSKCKLLWVYICCVVFANKIMYSTFSYKKKKMRVENGSYRIMQGSKNYNIKSDTDSCTIPQECNQYLVRQSACCNRFSIFSTWTSVQNYPSDVRCTHTIHAKWPYIPLSAAFDTERVRNIAPMPNVNRLRSRARPIC